MTNTFKAFIIIISSLFAISANSQGVVGGNNVVASGLYSSAAGYNTQATGTAAFAAGWNSIAEGNASFTFGTNSYSKLDYGISLGFGAKAYRMYGIAIGNNAISGTGTYPLMGNNAICIGNNSFAEGDYSIALGRYVKAGTTNSIVIGTGYNDSNYLTSMNPNSLAVGFNSTIPTLFVGSSSGANTIGKVGIGTTFPLEALHVSGKVKADALVLPDGEISSVESLKTWKTNAEKIYYPNGNVGIGTSTPSQKLEVQGNVFINDENSGLILKSQDGTQWKLRINNDGQLEVVQAENMEDLPQTETIDISPNPANESIQLSLAEKNFPVQVKVYDLEGTMIYMQAFYSKDIKINISAFPQGNYVLQVINHNQEITQTGKFLKM